MTQEQPPRVTLVSTHNEEGQESRKRKSRVEQAGTQSKIELSPAEHDAFCALWQAVVWDVMPHSHGRIPRPEQVVRQFFSEDTDASAFIRHLSTEPFSLIKFAFPHRTDRHEGNTYEAASDAQWVKVAQKIRVKGNPMRLSAPQEHLKASLEILERRVEELQKQHADVVREYESMMRGFEVRLVEHIKSIEAERTAIKKTQELLRQIGELTARQSSDQD